MNKENASAEAIRLCYKIKSCWDRDSTNSSLSDADDSEVLQSLHEYSIAQTLPLDRLIGQLNNECRKPENRKMLRPIIVHLAHLLCKDDKSCEKCNNENCNYPDWQEASDCEGFK